MTHYGTRAASRLALTLLLATGVASAQGVDASAGAEASPLVVALLVDGLSGAMVDAADTPTLDRLRAEGTWSHRFLPTFPAVSGPTWVSLSTGCWPRHHGVVTDKFIDPQEGLMDHDGDPSWLEGCELMHQVAERQGVRTAALGWWGQTSRAQGALASYVSATAAAEQRVPRDPLAYPPDAERAREIVGHLERPDDERPRLVLGYFRGPDHAAHFTGLDSAETRAAVEGFDTALGRVLAALERLSRRHVVTLLIGSDHGMVPVHHIVNLDRILRRHGVEAESATTGTTAFLYLDDVTTVDAAVAALATYEEFEVWRARELPPYANLGGGERIPSLIVSARPGYYMADSDLWPWYLRPLAVIGPDFAPSPLLGAGLRAAHGYSPETPGNQGVFYAWGTGIVEGKELDGVRMVDVHPTIARLLGIEPGSPVDGDVLHAALKTRNGETWARR